MQRVQSRVTVRTLDEMRHRNEKIAALTCYDASFAKVLEAAVIGLPDERRGETVKAFIVLKAGETTTEDEIISFCKERMAAYRVPRIIEFRDDLPKSMVGKVLRRELREQENARASE